MGDRVQGQDGSERLSERQAHWEQALDLDARPHHKHDQQRRAHSDAPLGDLDVRRGHSQRAGLVAYVEEVYVSDRGAHTRSAVAGCVQDADSVSDDPGDQALQVPCHLCGGGGDLHSPPGVGPRGLRRRPPAHPQHCGAQDVAADQALAVRGVQPEQRAGGCQHPLQLVRRRRRHFHPGGGGGVCGPGEGRAREEVPGAAPIPPRWLPQPEQHHPCQAGAFRRGLHHRRHRARVPTGGRRQVDSARRPVRDGDEGSRWQPLSLSVLPRRYQRNGNSARAPRSGRRRHAVVPRPHPHLWP
mmetsp:Transcript_24580/g.49815  ORF Transcript_24580/g.49815 Transcript_24580/m.49815 type:complete len:299 (-) Transcript_24580:429-1325(-)